MKPKKPKLFLLEINPDNNKSEANRILQIQKIDSKGRLHIVGGDKQQKTFQGKIGSFDGSALNVSIRVLDFPFPRKGEFWCEILNSTDREVTAYFKNIKRI